MNKQTLILVSTALVGFLVLPAVLLYRADAVSSPIRTNWWSVGLVAPASATNLDFQLYNATAGTDFAYQVTNAAGQILTQGTVVVPQGTTEVVRPTPLPASTIGKVVLRVTAPAGSSPESLELFRAVAQ